MQNENLLKFDYSLDALQLGTLSHRLAAESLNGQVIFTY